jgi:protocatechuate 3,4-dioxygenase beta subunit
VLRPAREISLAVVDDQQQPVAGAWAAVKIHWTGIADETTTDAAGQAVLRVPADANVEYVMGAKPDVGLDYFIYRRPDEPISDPYKLPPDHRETLTLTLNGVRPASVRVVDEQGRPLAGVQVAPWYFEKPNKGGYLNSGASWFQLSTDADGRAAFRTVPADLASDLTFWPHRDDFVLAERPVLRVQSATNELTATLLPMTPVAGRVTFADGRPAAGALVDVAGYGYQTDSFRESVRADENGRFELRVNPDQFYLFAAALDRWASPMESRVVRLGRPLGDVNLVLAKATRVYGRAAMAGDDRPIAGQYVSLYMYRDDNEHLALPEAEKLPNPKGDRKSIQPRIVRNAITNERGEFEFFTGPGRCYLMGPNNVEPPKFVITDQAEMELILFAQRPDRVEFAGQVVMKSAPSQMLKDVKVLGSPLGGRGGFLSAASGADGTFRVERTPSKMVLQALSADERLGAIVQIGPDDSLRVIQVVPTASARGRLVDAAGKPLAKRRIDFGLQFEKHTHTFYRQAATDDRGEFELDGFVPGEEYFIDVAVDGGDKSERPQKITIKVFSPDSAETIELGDVEVKPRP